MRIIFLGTPEFAVASLKALLESGHEIAAVVTATDKPGGRGRVTLTSSPVAGFAREKGLTLLQPSKLRDPEFLKTLSDFHADLFVVVAFRMLPESVWSMPPKGTLNLHGSLLPAFRGAAPIQWAILEGARETGVTVFRLKHEIDTGDILLQERLPVSEHETFGELYHRMMAVGARALCLAVRSLEEGSGTFRPQNDGEATPAPKIFQETARIDFEWPAERTLRWIRGMHPVPVAWFILKGRKIKIHKAKPAGDDLEGHSPGTLMNWKHRLLLACSDHWIELMEVQPEGKSSMPGRDFLNGLALPHGNCIRADQDPDHHHTI